MIEFENVDVTYRGGFKALKNVSLTIEQGELVVIYSECGPADEKYYEPILRKNMTIPAGAFAIRDVEGQANFVNPGTMLFNAGFDAELTPKLRTSVNYNSIWFSQTESVELLLNQNSIDQHVGEELNVLFQYRPFLNNNIIYTVGGSVFFPGDGFEDIYGSDETLYQVFMGLTLTY